MIEPEPGAASSVEIGWGRAIVSGIGIVTVALLAAVWAPDAVLKRMTSLSRDSRQYVASAVFLAVVIAVSWGLRKLQSRRLI